MYVFMRFFLHLYLPPQGWSLKYGVAGWIGSDRVSQFFLTEWVPPRFVSEISARAQPPARVPELICSPGRARTWLQDKHMP